MASQESSSLPALENRRIYIADNSATLLKLYQAILESEGYEVSTFREGAACLAAAEHACPALMIIGAELSDFHCVAFVKAMRAIEFLAEVPVIVISSSRSLELRRDCFQVGVTDFISKTATQNYLLDRVNRVLHREHQLSNNLQLNGERFHILVADDSPSILAFYGQMLEQMGTHTTLCKDGSEALKALKQKSDEIDLVITDLEMPNMSGQELVKQVRAESRFDQIPVIVVTRFEAVDLAVELLNNGATDFIHKPFSPEELGARIGAHLRNRRLYRSQQELSSKLTDFAKTLEDKVDQRTRELNEANKEMITKLSLVCDYKDKDTGNHITRVRLYCEEMGRALGFPEREIERLGYSSMLHDVGKVSIPDSILGKPGPLNPEEWAVMQQHTINGAELLGERAFFAMARDIALYHHERVDGTGYPEGLKGNEIPLSARIVAIVDVYDALTSKRCYKDAWSEADALDELKSIAGSHLDEELVHLLLDLKEAGKLDYIRAQYP